MTFQTIIPRMRRAIIAFAHAPTAEAAMQRWTALGGHNIEKKPAITGFERDKAGISHGKPYDLPDKNRRKPE